MSAYIIRKPKPSEELVYAVIYNDGSHSVMVSFYEAEGDAVEDLRDLLESDVTEAYVVRVVKQIAEAE